MDKSGIQAMLIVPAEEWEFVKRTLQEMQKQLQHFQPQVKSSERIVSPYITAKEFMAAVRICRSNFDKLVQKGKIMTLKKGRKVYVVATEVERYFREVSV